jgi:hypothetical protein
MNLAVQQSYRNEANEPQLLLATNAVQRLDAGASPASVTLGTPIDLAANLDTHITVYDHAGRVEASTARLNGRVPQPPSGMLDAAYHKTANILTWQPRSGVRVAAVVMAWKGGTVLVGRSLKYVEMWEDDLNKITGFGCLLGLFGLAAMSIVASALWPKTLPETV